jgi:hypothetical protein
MVWEESCLELVSGFSLADGRHIYICKNSGKTVSWGMLSSAALLPYAGLGLKPTPQLEPSQAPVWTHKPMTSPALGL